MPDPIAATSIYLLPGMTAKLMAPVSYKNDNGFAPLVGYAPASFFPNKSLAQLELKDGFIVEDTDVGEIEFYDEESLSVQYTHNKPAENSIWFFAADGESRAMVNIISVPIHDHSTIVHGGPAYGTYFDDDSER